MDPIVLMLLTVALNAVVTGILIFTFQKRLERALGRENFEYETRFREVYSKRVKTLEELVQKYLAFDMVVTSLVLKIVHYIDGEETSLPSYYESLNFELHTKFDELSSFWKSNRFYLSDDTNTAMMGVFVYSRPIKELLSKIGKDPMISKVPEEWITATGLPELIEMHPFEDADLSEPRTLVMRMSAEITWMTKLLEKKYRSEAGIKS